MKNYLYILDTSRDIDIDYQYKPRYFQEDSKKGIELRSKDEFGFLFLSFINK